MPSQYLGIAPDELDRDAERAFLLACMQKQEKEEKKARKKAENKARARRR